MSRLSARLNKSEDGKEPAFAFMLNKLIGEGKLERPRRNIRFWWVDEIGAEYRSFAENPDASKTVLANLNQDMVGARQSEGF